jgi:hypothetical protein
MEIRKLVTIVEETRSEMGRIVQPPGRRVAAVAVVKNPFAGQFVQDLTPLIDYGAELGALLGKTAVGALGGKPVSYGKAVVVGERGDMEHAAAIMHPKLGKPLRLAMGGGEAIIPSAARRGPAGTAVDCPIGQKDDVWSFPHFDSMTVSVPDAPQADELVVVVCVTDSGRPHARVGAARIL